MNMKLYLSCLETIKFDSIKYLQSVACKANFVSVRTSGKWPISSIYFVYSFITATPNNRDTNINACFSWLYYGYLLLLLLAASFRFLHCTSSFVCGVCVRCTYAKPELTLTHNGLRFNGKWVHLKNNNGNKHSKQNYFHKMWCWCCKVHGMCFFYGLLQSSVVKLYKSKGERLLVCRVHVHCTFVHIIYFDVRCANPKPEHTFAHTFTYMWLPKYADCALYESVNENRCFSLLTALKL